MGARRILRAAAAAALLFCALPARAGASSTQESVLQDDDQLIYAKPDHVASQLERIAELGVDRIRVSVVWSIVAPDPSSSTRPKFDAADPNAYPSGAWDRYDTIVDLAAQLGLKVDFQLTPPAPDWAVNPNDGKQGYAWSRDPSPRMFRDFVTAVGRRYSGSYAAPVPASQPVLPALPIEPPRAPVEAPGSQPTAGEQQVVPRVNYWEIWNEPNEPSWLNPVFRFAGRRPIPKEPVVYRSLVDAAGDALISTGHGGDTILAGETASFAPIEPGAFVQDLYCTDAADRPLSGSSAKDLGCPTSGKPADFVAAHPALFQIAGYAHHPYAFDSPPSARPGKPTDVTLSTLGTFERTLNAVFRTYGKLPRGGMPIYLSEWGYKTNPPNPYVHTSLGEQATWLNQGEYMAWLDPYVRNLGQFLLVDDNPRQGYPVGSKKYWGSFQTGLLYANGKPKPSYAAFRLPIWVPVARHGPRVTVWGQLRPADHSQVQVGTLQFRRTGTSSWVDLREVQTASVEGFFLAHVTIPAPGSLRLAWPNPSGATVYSRTVALR